MKPILRRQIHSRASAPTGTEGPVIDFCSSDETLDRYKERITVAGWKLDNYRKNPVVQNAHNYCSVSDTIGKSLITEIRSSSSSSSSSFSFSDPYLYQRILFAVNENPMAKVAYGLYKGGFLSAVSVGFIPLRWEDAPPQSSSSSSSSSCSYRRRYLEQELIEVSAVSIPANPNALALGIKSGAVEIGDVRELFLLLKHFCTAEVRPSSGAATSESPSAPNFGGVGRLPSAGASLPSDSGNQKSKIENQKSSMAGRGSTTSALGPASDEARLLHLKQQMDEIRAILRRT